MTRVVSGLSVFFGLAMVSISSAGLRPAAFAQQAHSEADPKQGGTLHIAFERWPSVGLLANNNSWIPLFQNQFESLVKMDDQGKLHPWLAKSWDISADGLTYTFILRDDVIFQDGEKFDAYAVKTTFDKLLDGHLTLVPARRVWGEFIKSVEVVDPHTLRLTLSAPDYQLLTNLSTLTTAIISPRSLANPAAKQGGVALKGTGPFELVEVIPDQKIVFQRFDKYNWAPETAKHNGPAYLDKLVFNWSADPAVRIGLLTSGQVDVAVGIGPDDISLVKDNTSYRYIEHYGNIVTWTWFFNKDGFGTSDIRVREAIIEALDLDRIVPAIFRGTGKHVWSQVAPGSVYYNPKYEGTYGNNSVKANKLLDDAGWTGRNAEGVRTNAKGEALDLLLINRGFVGQQKLFTEAVQQILLKQNGIKIRVEDDDEPKGFAHRDKGDYSIFHVTVASYDVGAALQLLWPTGGIINFSRLSDSKVDDWSARLRHTLTEEDRHQYIDKIVDYTQTDLKLSLPISGEFQNLATTKSVHNAEGSFAPLRSYPGPIAYDMWLDK